MVSLATANGKEIMALGDVNVSYLQRKDNKEFKEILNLLGLKQLIKEPTRICDTTKTISDVIASNKAEVIRETAVFPFGFSDHELIGCIRKPSHRKYLPKKIKCRNYNYYNVEEMNRELANTNW